MNWAHQQVQTAHANKQRYHWAQFILSEFPCKLSSTISALWYTYKLHGSVDFRCVFLWQETPMITNRRWGQTRRRWPRWGARVWEKHTKLEVMIEESYEFKVSPVKQEKNNTAFMKMSYLLSLSHSISTWILTFLFLWWQSQYWRSPGSGGSGI